MLDRNDRRAQTDPRRLVYLVERRELHSRLADAGHRRLPGNRRGKQRLYDVPRHTRIATRKHLRTVLLLPGKEQIRSVIAVSREHVRPNARTASGHRREIAADGIAAQPMTHHQVLFERDRVKLACNGVSMTPRRGAMVRHISHRQQLALRLSRNRSAFQLLRPRIDQPHAIRVAERPRRKRNRSCSHPPHMESRPSQSRLRSADIETAVDRFPPNHRNAGGNFPAWVETTSPIPGSRSNAVHPH